MLTQQGNGPAAEPGSRPMATYTVRLILTAHPTADCDACEAELTIDVLADSESAAEDAATTQVARMTRSNVGATVLSVTLAV